MLQMTSAWSDAICYALKSMVKRGVNVKEINPAEKV